MSSECLRKVFASKDKSKEACEIDLKQDDTSEEDLTKIKKHERGAKNGGGSWVLWLYLELQAWALEKVGEESKETNLLYDYSKSSYKLTKHS